jgi:hypothetical protein
MVAGGDPWLLSACRKMLLMPRPDRKEQSKEWSGLYSRDTCFEFHQLLVSTLLNYGKALDSLGAAHGAHLKKPNEQEPVQKMVDSAKQIWEHGRLLWAIAYSRILVLVKVRTISALTHPMVKSKVKLAGSIQGKATSDLLSRSNLCS